MSPSVPILFALSLALISGSAESGQRIPDPVALLRQTLRYWRKIYDTYHEEVTLGYCWADYLLEISDELSANLSASLAATGYPRETTTAADTTRSRRKNASPENVTEAGVTRHRESREYLREKRRSYPTVVSGVSNPVGNSDGRRIAARREKTFRGERERRTTKVADRHVARNNARENNETDGDKRITPAINSRVGRRRRALPITPELSYEEREPAPRDHGFPSRATTSRIVVDPTADPKDDPKDDDELDSTSSWQENARCKAPRPPASHRDSFVEVAASGPRSFSLEVLHGRGRRSLDGHPRFPFRRYPVPREKSTRVSVPLSELELADPGTRRDPVLRRAPSDGRSTTPSRLPQPRRTNAGPWCRVRVVKLADPVKNSSRYTARAINSVTGRKRTPAGLSRDTLLSRRLSAIAVRSLLESRGNGRKAVSRNHARSAARGDETGEHRYRQSRKGEGWRGGRDVLPARILLKMAGGFLSSDFKRSRRRTPYKNRPFLSVPEREYTEVSGEREYRVRIARGASPPHRVRQFTGNRGDGENSTRESIENSRSNVSLYSENNDRRSLVQAFSLTSGLRSFIVGVLRTLGMFVQVGRQIIDIVESNTALVCTKDYLWMKIIRWIDM